MGHENVLHGVTIGGDVLLCACPVPVFPEHCLKQPWISAGWISVESV